MRLRLLGVGLVASSILALSAFGQQQSQNFRSPAAVISSGVKSGGSENYSQDGTLGDQASSPSSSLNFKHQAGFQVRLLGSFVGPDPEKISLAIRSYYINILGRMPDAGGVEYWQGEANRVQTLGADVREVFYALAVQFFNSPEYIAKNRDITGYIGDLYLTFFNRAPDSGGIAYWRSQVDGGMDRGALLTNFLFSDEFAATMTNLFGTSTPRAEVNMLIDLYRGILGNLPDSGGFAYWLGRIRAAQCVGANAVNTEVTTISQLFLASAQYVAIDNSRPAAQRNHRHVGDLYNAFLRRGADLGGYSFWIGQLNTGAMTREVVRSQFVASPEFQGRVRAVITQGCF